eukprot:TRINITY_DN8204_c0_g3_i1.p1 TRINITY_DN8204_c0_g3~~TRINITY_DN8204_c0_g3_i1.p1  ORF type:complete len:2963 (+),score=1018.44 TRINITY_DN8204_c0_g3_i1:240-9128(+)
MWSGKDIGRGSETSTAPLEHLKKLLITVHASDTVQQQQIDAVVNSLTKDDSQELPDSIVLQVNKEIKSLFGGDTASKMLGMRLLRALIDADYWDFVLKITFFYNLMKSVLPSADPQTVSLAAKCIGEIAAAGIQRDGGIITVSIVEEETRRSTEWLSASIDKYNRWYSACSILISLVANVPELVMARSELFLERVWGPMWSESKDDREIAVKCFKAIIDMAFTDDQDWSGLFSKIISKIFEGLNRHSISATHGSLMCLRELLYYSEGQLQLAEYKALATSVLDNTTEDIDIQIVTLEVLPRMGRHYETLFGVSYMEETMTRVSKLYRVSQPHRHIAFWALSELCTVLNSSVIEAHIPAIIGYIRQGIQESDLRGAALKLLGILCTSCPMALEVELGTDEWHEYFRAAPLTENHFEALQAIMCAIPSLKKDLLAINKEIINRALADTNSEHLALVLKSVSQVDCCIPAEHGAAIELLEAVMKFRTHDEVEIRAACVEASVAIVQFLTLQYEESSPSEQSLCDGEKESKDRKPDPLMNLLEPIVDVAVVDMDPMIRHKVLSLLEAPAITKLISTPSCIDCLFMAVNDTVPENRRLALLCLCHLSHNKTVLAGLTKISIQLSEDINALRENTRQQAHCSELLALLIKHVPAVVLPIAFDILHIIKARLSSSLSSRNPALVSSLLTTLGELNDLIDVDDVAARSLLIEFLPLVLGCLEDRHNLNKRVAAVHALMKIIRSTGLVIDFYEEYPHVLPVLLGFLQSKEDWRLQSGVMRLIGTIGAVDPLRAKNLSFWADIDESGIRRRAKDPEGKKKDGKVELHRQLMKSSLRHQIQHRSQLGVRLNLELPMRSSPQLLDQLPAVALQALLLILASHSITHPKAIDAIKQVIKSLSHEQLVKYCPALLDPILNLLKTSSSLGRDTHSKLFQLLNTLVVMLDKAIKSHCETILNILRDYWDQVIKEAMNQQRVQLPLQGISDAETVNNTSNDSGGGSGKEGPSSGDRFGEPAHEEKPLEAAASVPVETLLINLISLIEEVNKVHSKDEMTGHSKWILQNLIQSMQIDKMERMELVKKCFDSFKTLAVCMREHLHVLLPVLLDALSHKELTVQIKIRAMTTLQSILESVPIKEHTARVLHNLLLVLRDTANEGRSYMQLTDFGLRCIHVMIKNSEEAFIRFIPLTKKMLGNILARDAALGASILYLEQHGKLPEEAKKQDTPKKPDPRVFRSEESPTILSCTMDKRVELFNADSFKKTVSTHLKINPRCVEVLRTRGPICTVDFRFIEMDAASQARYTTMFVNSFKNSNNGVYHDPLTYELRLVEVKEKQVASLVLQTSALKQIWTTRGRRKHRDWEEWINRFSIELLKHSPSQSLRACFQVAQTYTPIARDLFSYSFVACFLELDEQEKVELLSNMNHALHSDLPPSVLHMILTLAEFMEEERYPKRTAVCTAQGQTFKLTRASTSDKFGVGYTDDHQGTQTRVKVSKIQPKLAGDKANLPIGGIVLKLNGQRVLNVKQLSVLLQDQTVITLELQMPFTNTLPRHVNKPGPFFDVDLLAEVCEKKQLLAKAFHYKEEQFRKLITEIQESKRAAPDEINKLSVQFIDLCSDLIHLSNNLGLREGANGILDFSKKYFEDWNSLEAEDEVGATFSKLAGKQLDTMLLIEGRGYEKLQWWSQAIKAYKSQAAEAAPGDRNKFVIGIMRCYRQLGRWEHLLYEAKRSWDSLKDTEKQEVSSMATHGAWILSAWSNLGESIPSHWDFMETCLGYMLKEEEAAETEFFRAIIAVHKEEYTEAESHINVTRKLLEGRLSSLVGESYSRAYNVIMWLQKVRGLEEVIEYKNGNTIKWPQLREVWHKRMFGMQPTVENWQDMLGIMALVLDRGALTELDSDDLALWLKFVSICRRCNRNSLAESTLLTLMGFSTRNFRNFLTDDTIDQHLSKAFIDAQELIDRNVVGHVCLSYFKHLYHCDMRSRAVDELRTYVENAVNLRQRTQKIKGEIDSLRKEIQHRNEKQTFKAPKHSNIGHKRSASAGELDFPNADLYSEVEEKEKELEKINSRLSTADLDDDDLLSKAHLTLGEWCQDIHKDNFWENPHREEILRHFEQSVELTKTSSRSWHAWGLLNYRIAFRSDNLATPDEDAAPSTEEHEKRKEAYLVQSLRGFFNSLDYLEDESFCVPNLLRILTIWFRYAHKDNIATELHRGIRSMRVSTWIYVLPQLVARVSFPQQKVRSQVEDLLLLLGSEYPHHVVYPLTVCAVHGDTTSRRKCAQEILDRLSHGDKETMFTQAKIVSQGLIKTAISWAESWLTNLATLEEAWTTDKKASRKMVFDMFQMLDVQHPTVAEQNFLKLYRSELDTAKRYLLNENFPAAWEIFKSLCKQFDAGIQKNHQIYLTEVSPDLMAVKGYEVAVPGVSKPTDAKTVQIHTFQNEVKVISSKQKPKVIIMLGDDGMEYKFLLKGHEDLRQDERVMQLFGLINALFQRTDDLYHINIITTPVVPLSDNVGLIGWLERTETLNHMIRGYRMAHNIPHNKEVLFILAIAPQLKRIEHFHQLTDREKKDYLQACVDRTPSDCLRKVFWTRTVASEAWVEYRTHYVRTLAAMSMVGYILGLGDRHLNNIMLTDEGNVVHIDFGDCFEVALNRQRFPEKVPFRLTRLLVSAMEASGTEGTFRHTCESVMRCLRKNRDSLTSLLETFVYDPLINWRLLETVAPEEAEAVQEREAERARIEEENEDKPEGISAAVFAHKIPDDIETTHDEDEEERRKTTAGVDEMQIPADEENTESDEMHAPHIDQQGDMIAKSAQITQMSVPRSMALKSLRLEVPGVQKDDRAWEEELVNEKAKQVVIRIREKLTGYDFPSSLISSRNPPSPKGVSPRQDPADAFDPVASRYMMGGSYEGSWVLKTLDDECDVGVSVAHRETWWLQQNPQAASSDDSKERCTVAEQVNQLILAATSVENLSQMYIGWAPFC